ncbi:MAG: nitrilase-related carbon-nitrogen hydrolase [Halobacteriota archaeon]
MSIKLACIQMGATGTWADNVQRAVTMMRSTDAEFVVLPELFNYCKDFKTGEPIPGRTTEVFTALAREKGVYIVMGSILEVESQPSVTASPLLYNTSILIDPSGSIVAKYRKIHLFAYHSKERYFLKPGQDIIVADTDIGTVGLSICYDIRFPELYRALIKRGAEIIVCPAAWPYPRLEHWVTFNKARAIEEQCYFISCNQVGAPLPTQTFLGHSMIVDPWGTVVASGGDGETVVEGKIDVEFVRKVRSEYTFLKDIVEL